LLRTGVFLDRDDTVIKDVPYLSDPDKVELMPGAAEAVSLLNSRNIPAILVTNQSGIARGIFDEAALEAVNNRFIYLLEKSSARLDAIYLCPHYPGGIIKKYAIECTCRKPQPGLLIKAAHDFSLDLKSCYFIGDKDSDMEAIHRVGGNAVLVGNRADVKSFEYKALNILDAVNWILNENER